MSSIYIGRIGHVLHVWNLHMSCVRMRVHVRVRVRVPVRVCSCVPECVRVCQARQVYRHGEFTDTLCLQNKNKTVRLQTRYVYKTKTNQNLQTRQ